MPRFVSKALRRPVHRLAALVVALVFLSLPTLTRVHDRASAVDNTTAFRLSKNIQRPSERHTAVAVSATVAPRVADALPFEAPPPVADAFERPSTVTPGSLRAPPAR
jgi:hypothetical protein